jgi:hypothetical protein
MNNGQKQAWYFLVVIALSMIVVLGLTPMLGFKRAQGGLGLLGLLGFAPFLFRKRPGAVAYDERDALIQSRSWVIAYSVFWIVFVAVCVTAPYTFGQSGTVPVFVVELSVWYAFILVWGVSSLAAVIQYGCGGSDGTP